MPRLSRSQETARRSILDAANGGYSPEAFGRRVMSALTAAIPCDGFRLFAVDPSSLLNNRLLAASDTDGWARAEWLRDVYLRSGEFQYIELPVLMRAGIVAVALHETQDASLGFPKTMLDSLDADDHYRLFHELRSPVGGTLLTCFPADGRWVAALQAYRRDPRSPFRPSDVAFFRMMAPVIAKGIDAAINRERAMSTALSSESASGILIVGADGVLKFSTPAGEALSAVIDEPGRSEHGPVPTAVWAAIAKLRTEGGAATSVLVPTGSGKIRVEASPAAADGSVAIVLTPQRPLPLPESMPEWPLTGGERRIVDLVMRGSTNKQIAEALFISPNTVEWHLRGAYEKLGVRSRLELLAKLFEETAPPPLIDPAAAEPSEPSVATRP